MTDADLMAPFDDEVVRAVAAENDVDRDVLADTLVDHQRTMQENPGVEDLVYEWRKQYADPVLERTPDRYVVGVRATVWEEYGEYLDLEDQVLAALVAVHQEQVLRTLSEDALAGAEDLVPLIAVRPARE
jgi:hypothetical protein